MTETRVEYAVRYDDPTWQDKLAGTTVYRGPCEDSARMAHACGVAARVVQRTVTVTYGEWEPVQ